MRVDNALGLLVFYQYLTACCTILLDPIIRKFGEMTLDDVVHNMQKWDTTWRYVEASSADQPLASSYVATNSPGSERRHERNDDVSLWAGRLRGRDQSQGRGYSPARQGTHYTATKVKNIRSKARSV